MSKRLERAKPARTRPAISIQASGCDGRINEAGHTEAPESVHQYLLRKNSCFLTGLSLIASRLSMSFYFCRRRTGVTVLSAVGRIRRNIWSEAQALQCPQRACVIDTAQGPRSQPPVPSPRWATITSVAKRGWISLKTSLGSHLQFRPAERFA